MRCQSCQAAVRQANRERRSTTASAEARWFGPLGENKLGAPGHQPCRARLKDPRRNPGGTRAVGSQGGSLNNQRRATGWASTAHSVRGGFPSAAPFGERRLSARRSPSLRRMGGFRSTASAQIASAASEAASLRLSLHPLLGPQSVNPFARIGGDGRRWGGRPNLSISEAS